MSAYVLLLMPLNAERFEVQVCAELSAPVLQRLAERGLDAAQSCVLRFESPESAHAFSNNFNVRCMAQEVRRLSRESVQYEVSAWFELTTSVRRAQRSAELEILSLREILGSVAVDGQDMGDESTNSTHTKALSGAPSLDVHRLLIENALRELKAACTGHIALLPIANQQERGGASHELVGIFASEQFMQGMSALGVLESDTRKIWFGQHESAELDQVRNGFDFAFRITVRRDSTQDSTNSEIRAAREQLFSASVGIAGWDLPMSDDLLLSAVAAEVFSRTPVRQTRTSHLYETLNKTTDVAQQRTG